MIVYNVNRRFYAMKADAEDHRKTLGLKPDATLKLEINTREDLAALLTDLCDPPPASDNTPATPLTQMIDRAFVPPDKDVPRFLRESWSRLLRSIG